MEELSRKLQDLNRDVQQERANARVIMDTLLLEDAHIKRLAALPVSLRERAKRPHIWTVSLCGVSSCRATWRCHTVESWRRGLNAVERIFQDFFGLEALRQSMMVSLKVWCLLQEVRAAEQEVMLEKFRKLAATLGKGVRDITQCPIREWVDWFGAVRLLSSQYRVMPHILARACYHQSPTGVSGGLPLDVGRAEKRPSKVLSNLPDKGVDDPSNRNHFSGEEQECMPAVLGGVTTRTLHRSV